MRRGEDWRSLFFLSTVLVFQWAVVFYTRVSASELGPVAWVCLFFLNMSGVFVVSLINHNHRHCGIFKNPRANKLVDFFISLAMLAPSTRLHTVHVLNHHAHYDSDKDWATYKLADTDSRGLARSVQYLKRAYSQMQRHRSSLKLTEDLARSLKFERVAVYLYSGVLLFLAPKAFLFWLLPSCALGLLLLLLANLINHDGCELQSRYNHSRNFISPLENFFFCNNGYHTVHHLRPSMHWSQYPKYHREEVESKIRPEFQQPSFLVHLLRNYIFCVH